MIEDALQKKIDEARVKLPSESREAIDNVNWKLLILGLKKFTPDQLDDLEIETELMLYGITSPEDYPIELEDRMHLTKEDTIALVGEMNRLVFQRIEMELKRILDEKDKFKNRPMVFDQRFSKLPKDVQQAIAQSGWRENLYEISKKYKLNIEQMGILEKDTVKLITNEISPLNYENVLKTDISNLDKENTASLVNEINEKIMLRIRKLLKEQIAKQEETPNLGRKDSFDKIPLPPYSRIRTEHPEPIAPLRIKKEESQLKSLNFVKTNFEIKKNKETLETKNNIKKEEDAVLVPPKIEKVSKNIIEEKLNNIISGDNSLPTNNNNNLQSKSTSRQTDPYREAF